MATRVIETGNPGVHRIGRYDLVAEIASGGMATVYLARLSGVGGFQRNVAIKVLHPHLAYDDEFVEMFLDEARLAAMIHHPNVVPILEVGEGEHGYYLVMDYVEGDTFAVLLSRAAGAVEPVPQEIVLRVGLDMLGGLNAAHELQDERGNLIGVVHRDVSPQNVLVGTDGVTRLTDFGVARAATRLSATRAGQLKGKLAYMAPEQATGDENIDRRADVFSSGIVLWEAFALRRLFKASNEAATLSRVMTEPIRSPRDFNANVPAAVAQVCLYALSRDANARYARASDFAEALEDAAIHSGVSIATNREVAAYVARMVGADVEAHRAAIRQWLDKRDAMGGFTSTGSGRVSQVPIPLLPLRSIPPVEPSSTFSSWSIAGYPGRTATGRPLPRNTNLGSSRPPASNLSGVSGFGAHPAYKPVPGYGPNGLPLGAIPALPPVPVISAPPSFSVEPGPPIAKRGLGRGAKATLVAGAALVFGLITRFALLSDGEGRPVEVTSAGDRPSLASGALAAQPGSLQPSGNSGAAASASGASAAAQVEGTKIGSSAASSNPNAAPKSESAPVAAAPPVVEKPVVRPASPARPAIPAEKPRVSAPKPAPKTKPSRKRSVPNLDNPYQ